MKKILLIITLVFALLLTSCIKQTEMYSVEFVDFDGTVLHSETYEYGLDLSKVIPPNDPIREDYLFTGWDNPIPSIMPSHDLVFMPTYISFSQLQENGTINFDRSLDDYEFDIQVDEPFIFDVFDEYLVVRYYNSSPWGIDITSLEVYTLNGISIIEVINDFPKDIPFLYGVNNHMFIYPVWSSDEEKVNLYMVNLLNTDEVDIIEIDWILDR